MQHVPPKCYTIRREMGRLDVEIYWSKLVRVGFYKGLRWPFKSRIIFTEDSMGEERDIDRRKNNL